MAYKKETARGHALALERYFVLRRDQAWNTLMGRVYRKMTEGEEMDLEYAARDYCDAVDELQAVRYILGALQIGAPIKVYTDKMGQHTECVACGGELGRTRIKYCDDCARERQSLKDYPSYARWLERKRRESA